MSRQSVILAGDYGRYIVLRCGLGARRWERCSGKGRATEVSAIMPAQRVVSWAGRSGLLDREIDPPGRESKLCLLLEI
jgi:hypothetical protein